MYHTRRILSYAAVHVARTFPRPQCQRISPNVSTVRKRTQTAGVEQPTRFRDMPGPTMIDNLLKYRKDGVGNHHLILAERYEKYGATFKFEVPGKTMVCTCDPDNIEKVFRAEGHPANRGDDFLVGSTSYLIKEKGLERGLLGNDESWYVQRSAVASKMLRPVALKPFISDLCAVSDETIAYFKEGRNLDLLPKLLKWSTESMGVVILGERIGVNAETPDKVPLDFIQAVCSLVAIEAKLQFSFPFHKYFKTPTLKLIYSHVEILWNLTDYYVTKIRDQERGNSSALESVVQHMIYDGKLSHDEIIQIGVVLFAGGVDTTSSTLLVLLYFISEFPKAQQKLYEEIEQTLPNRMMPTHDHLSKMPYLKAVIKEAARIQPTAPGTVRQLKESITLSGYEVPPETPIILSFFTSSSMKKKNFGDDFENFNPDRWLSGSKKIHPFAWTRFGFGPRMCVGRRVAELEMGLFLIRLLQKYEIEVRRSVEDKMAWHFQLILNPAKPFNINLKRRK